MTAERRRSPRVPPSYVAGNEEVAEVRSRTRWVGFSPNRPFLVEVFIALNFSFLTLDIYVAHSVNAFARAPEWIPLAYTIAAALAVLVNLTVSAPVRGVVGGRAGRGGVRSFREGAGWWLGVVVGVAGVAVGVAGMLWHLHSNFFQALTLRTLVYSAPFVAPLAFTGLGLLLLANRLVPTDSVEWGQWVLILSWGGFLGNFALSLLDHAQNGFFYTMEWMPVVVAAFVVGWLLVPIFVPVPHLFFRITLGVLALAVVTGLVGFVLHVYPALTEDVATLRERIIYGAPVFAPLLFPNLALLSGIGVWDMWAKEWVSDSADGGPEM